MDVLRTTINSKRIGIAILLSVGGPRMTR